MKLNNVRIIKTIEDKQKAPHAAHTAHRSPFRILPYAILNNSENNINYT